MPNPVGFTIYTRAGRKCPWCDKAAEVLDQEGLRYHIRPLGISDLRKVANRANMTTVPIIYHGVRLVGGYEDLLIYLKQAR